MIRGHLHSDHSTVLTTSQERSNRLVRLATASVVTALMAVSAMTAGDLEAKDETCWSHLHPNTRSILLIESKEAPLEAADAVAPPAVPLHPNIRSILVVEGLRIPTVVTGHVEPSALAVHPDTRSILVIEGREPPVEAVLSGC